jgi:phospholipid/cholesterol/gamma-HCH transport system substrate-binding protein
MKGLKATIIKVIVFSVVGVLMTIALGAKLANTRLFADTYVLQAEFENAAGAMRGDAVKLAGVDIGRVERAEIENGKAVITFNLDKDVRLPKDSTVALRWRNVLGQRFLYVHPGSGSDHYEENERISVENTQDVSDIGEFLNRLGPILKAIDPAQANAFLDSINTALAGNEQSVRRLLSDGAVLARTLGNEDQEIKGLLTAADEIMATYASQDQAIGQIFDDLDSVGGMLARRTTDINSLITDFSVVQKELDGLLRRSRSNIDASLGSLDTVARTLADNRVNLSQTLRTLPMGTAGYFQTSSWGEWFNVRIVAITVHDQNTNLIVREDEQDNQRGKTGGTPQVGKGANDGYHKNKHGEDYEPRRGSGKKGRDGGQRSREGTPDGTEGIEAVLRFVLSGDAS